ncbi:MAG: histidinol dehydrogenase [Rickettsiales bacterium]|nr:histidinol dehydrogenase [Rickettsiales bacterium]
MTLRLDANELDFEASFKRLLDMREAAPAQITEAVANIIADVRINGDDALKNYTQQFDHLDLSETSIELSEEEIDTAIKDCPDETLDALKLAAGRLKRYHEKQLPSDEYYIDETGTGLGWRWRPIDAVGIYVPGGRATYPSSVMHNAIPAKVAGVERVQMVVPTPHGIINPVVIAAAKLSEVDAIYRVGGAQAVAALAFGTDSIPRVASIVGPGNAYVAEAKRQVFGAVGIDMIAGPSEILVVADDKNDPEWMAADLMSQAEHDPMAQSILITDSVEYANQVSRAIDALLKTLERSEIASQSWQDFGAIITVDSLTDAIPLINRIAPEHLELAIDNPEEFAQGVRHAGAIFLGRHTPEAIGDYLAGPSHVLPTSQTARFSSGLSVNNFIKKSSLIRCTADSIQAIGHQAAHLADSEGLGAHALSVRKRLEK